MKQVQLFCPKQYEKILGHKRTRRIFDACELFFQTPSDCMTSRNTWSEYKHHHTAKFLASIEPSGGFDFVTPPRTVPSSINHPPSLLSHYPFTPCIQTAGSFPSHRWAGTDRAIFRKEGHVADPGQLYNRRHHHGIAPAITP
jgi:hypothetical protein